MWELWFNPTGFPADAAVIWQDDDPNKLYKLIHELIEDSEGEWHPCDFWVQRKDGAHVHHKVG